MLILIFKKPKVAHLFYIASEKGHTDVVAILLKNNANPDLPKNGCTPLFIASQEGQTDALFS